MYVKNNKAGKKGFRICLICKNPYPAIPLSPVLFKPHDNPECIKELFQRAHKLLKGQIQKQARENKKAMRENLKTKGDFERDLQTEINQIVKYIDASWPCISSGKMTGKRNAGHFYSVGAYPTIRFNLFNIYNQSEYQNTYKSGNPIGYREGLINTFGIPHMTYVENLKNYPPIKLTIEQLKEAISNARTILKELKKNECVYTVEQRLEKRREFNLKIGIYND